MVKRIRQVRKTLLIVCEGESDRDFLHHLKTLYLPRENSRVELTIRRADGGGGSGVARTLVNCRARYDRYLAMYDADFPPNGVWGGQLAVFSKKWDIRELAVTPQCLEGMCLNLFEQKAPEFSDQCKKALAKHLGDGEWCKNLVRHLPRELLDRRRQDVGPLDKLLSTMLDW